MTISLESQGSLLVARAQGFADELGEGKRIVDAVRAECARVAALDVIVDFGDLAGGMTQAYLMEIERYAQARFARCRCALVLPPGGGAGALSPPTAVFAVFAVFADRSAALEWLRRPSGASSQAVPAKPPERTLVHLL